MPTYWEIDEDKFYQQIYKEMGKTKSETLEYVEILKKWASEQPHFPEMPTFNLLLMTISGCKFSMEKAKSKMDMYYTIRRLMPEIFQEHPFSPKLLKMQKIMYMLPLPKLGDNSHRIVFGKFDSAHKPEEFIHEKSLIQILHLVEVYVQEDKSVHFSMILDCGTTKLAHLPRFSPMVVKKLVMCIEKLFANRVQGIYLINFFPRLEHLINAVFKPFVPKKILDRVHMIVGTEGIFKVFNKSILPKDIGGEERSLDDLREAWNEKLQEWKPRFDQIQFMQVDESKRPSKLENDDILGYYGSFKQISID